MSVNLKLTIKGLALFKFGSDKQWKLFFPAASNHPFKMKIAKEFRNDTGTTIIEKSEFLFPTLTRIDFTPNDPTKPTSSVGGDLIDERMGLAPLHEKYYGEKPVLSSDLGKYAGFLNLNGTELKRKDFDDQYDAEVYNVFVDPTKPPEEDTVKTKIDQVKVGSDVIDEYSVAADAITNIKIKNLAEFEINLTYSKGEKYCVEISNDCDSKLCEMTSDFHYYYRILEELKGKFEFVLIIDETMGKNGGCDPTPGGGGEGEDNFIPLSLMPFIS